jgi:hypothetical protein
LEEPRRSGSTIGGAKIVEVAEVLNHQFDDLGVFVRIVSVLSILRCRPEFDDAGLSFLHLSVR